jgi:mRNA interferase MazF
MTTPVRGEVWRVRFDPTEGAEIQKIRPSVVMSVKEVGILPLHIVVPITEWQAAFAAHPWFVRIRPTQRNGLRKDSAADAFQVKSLSIVRFVERLGVLTAPELAHISAAIALCVGYA